MNERSHVDCRAARRPRRRPDDRDRAGPRPPVQRTSPERACSSPIGVRKPMLLSTRSSSWTRSVPSGQPPSCVARTRPRLSRCAAEGFPARWESTCRSTRSTRCRRGCLATRSPPTAPAQATPTAPAGRGRTSRRGPECGNCAPTEFAERSWIDDHLAFGTVLPQVIADQAAQFRLQKAMDIARRRHGPRQAVDEFVEPAVGGVPGEKRLQRVVNRPLGSGGPGREPSTPETATHRRAPTGPRLAGRTARSRSPSTRSKNASSPRGQPIISAARRATNVPAPLPGDRPGDRRSAGCDRAAGLPDAPARSTTRPGRPRTSTYRNFRFSGANVHLQRCGSGFGVVSRRLRVSRPRKGGLLNLESDTPEFVDERADDVNHQDPVQVGLQKQER